MKCDHEQFGASVDVHRIVDDANPNAPKMYLADVRVVCVQCQTPFRFLGLPAGLDLTGASTSPDATEGRFAVAPKGEVVSVIEGAPLGFSIKKTG